jgi:hypothetical protein
MVMKLVGVCFIVSLALAYNCKLLFFMELIFFHM